MAEAILQGIAEIIQFSRESSRVGQYEAARVYLEGALSKISQYVLCITCVDLFIIEKYLYCTTHISWLQFLSISFIFHSFIYFNGINTTKLSSPRWDSRELINLV